jgi:hypothetical protein
MKAVFQVSRAASDTAMVVSVMLVASVPGGVHRSLQPRILGSAAWTISMALQTGSTAIG